MCAFKKLFSISKPKICYVVPELYINSHTHFAYLEEFLEEMKKVFDVYVIPEMIGNKFINFLPLRALRVFILIFRARLCGFKKFYVHYSFFGAFSAALIVKILGGCVFYWNCGEPWKYKRNFLRENFERLVYRLITVLVTGAESLAREYSKYYKIPIRKIKIMPNWINLKSIKVESLKLKADELKKNLGIKKETKILLFVHRLSKRKGAHYLPKILNQLCKHNIMMIIIGDGPERENIEMEFHNLGLENIVRLLGWMPHGKIMAYFAAANIFIMPSDEEGFPHVLLETMAAGVPFVAHNVGAVFDVIPLFMRDYLVPVGDITAFSQKIKELIFANYEESKKMNQLLMNWVTRYDISVVFNKFIEIIK